ncbi:hypothetical protein [Bacillus sinesaloumensis]|uniref:hypothetical protein n=1 Tax=Litchfieldia sinesaloumensis TaxID=1926280 RepID=UPI00098842D6|nr:hypothetical protein [Bacillus sinesaloumensis]
MNNSNFIKQSLYFQGLPIYETDIPHIQRILFTVNQAQRSLYAFPNLNSKVPITIVDKRLLR